MLLTIFRVTGGSAPSDSNTLLADRLVTSTLLPPTSWTSHCSTITGYVLVDASLTAQLGFVFVFVFST